MPFESGKTTISFLFGKFSTDETALKTIAGGGVAF